MNLPQFNRNVTELQTFCDCFESNIHFNTTLSNVKKFSYLRPLLYNKDAACIAGFQLTHSNYRKAVDLLKELYGQPHKIISAYMQSLLELPRPDNRTFSQQIFITYKHSLGLESLRQCQDSCGDLLVYINRFQVNLSAAWLVTMATNNVHFQYYVTKSRSEISARRNHRTNSCTFSDSIIFHRKQGVKCKILCFNCLQVGERYQIIGCKLLFRCQYCQRKHHYYINCMSAATVSLLISPD